MALWPLAHVLRMPQYLQPSHRTLPRFLPCICQDLDPLHNLQIPHGKSWLGLSSVLPSLLVRMFYSVPSPQAGKACSRMSLYVTNSDTTARAAASGALLLLA